MMIDHTLELMTCVITSFDERSNSVYPILAYKQDRPIVIANMRDLCYEVYAEEYAEAEHSGELNIYAAPFSSVHVTLLEELCAGRSLKERITMLPHSNNLGELATKELLWDMLTDDDVEQRNFAAPNRNLLVTNSYKLLGKLKEVSDLFHTSEFNKVSAKPKSESEDGSPLAQSQNQEPEDDWSKLLCQGIILKNMQFMYATIQDKDVVVQYPFYVDPTMVNVVKRAVEREAERLADLSKRQTCFELNVYVRPLLELHTADILSLCGGELPASIKTTRDLEALHATPVAPSEVYGGHTLATEAIRIGMLHYCKQFRLGEGSDLERSHERAISDMPLIYKRVFHPKPSNIKGE